MHDHRVEIMALPEDERLAHALDVIEAIAGKNLAHRQWLQLERGLTPTEAQMLLALHAAAPNVVSREGLYVAAYGYNGEPNTRIVDVFMSKLRRKGFVVNSVWAVGYAIPAPLEIGAAA